VIDEVAATNEFVLMFVDVELVIVPFVTLISVPEKPGPVIVPVTAKLVTVALVRVAFVEVKYEVEAVRRFAESELVVEAFVVDAFSVAKLAVVPHRVVIVPDTAEKIFETKFEIFALVEVELVIVPLVAVIDAPESPGAEKIPVTAKFVIVALVNVAFPALSAEATNSANTALLE
jgi:hypothetical protein